MTSTVSKASTPQDVLDFWFDDCHESPEKCKEQSKLWYASDEKLDEQVTLQFGDLYEKACLDSLSSWGETSEGALALVILLDQFSRQIHRKTSQAFSQDPMARAIAIRTVHRGLDKELSVPGRLFLYHPFQHSEFLADQEFGVEVCGQLLEECSPEWKDTVQNSIEFFEGHREVVRQFGRFPHRNEVLGRESTPDELKYLEDASRYGQ